MLKPLGHRCGVIAETCRPAPARMKMCAPRKLFIQLNQAVTLFTLAKWANVQTITCMSLNIMCRNIPTVILGLIAGTMAANWNFRIGSELVRETTWKTMCQCADLFQLDRQRHTIPSHKHTGHAIRNFVDIDSCCHYVYFFYSYPFSFLSSPFLPSIHLITPTKILLKKALKQANVSQSC